MIQKTLNEYLSQNVLILSCSSKKKNVPQERAIDLYEGQAHRMVRSFLDQYPETNLSVFILSAKYGLIDALEKNEDLWEPYDLIMDPVLSSNWHYILEEALEPDYFNEKNSFFYGGELYRMAFPFKIPHSHGLIGKQLHQLKEWLKKVNGEKR